MKAEKGLSLPEELKKAAEFLSINDPVMGEIISKIGPCSIITRENYFEALVRSVIGQQLSVKAAANIYGRLLASVNHQLTAETVSSLSAEELKTSGISKQKAAYMKNLANAFLSNKDFFARLKDLPDEEVLRELTKIKGIGLWTAQIFLIFSLNRLNVLPLGDAGLKRSVAVHYQINKPTDEHIRALATKWGNYSSVAVWYLWKGLDSMQA